MSQVKSKTYFNSFMIETGLHLKAYKYSFYCCWNPKESSAQILNYCDKIQRSQFSVTKRLNFNVLQCVICQDDFSDDFHVCMLQCRHFFHMTCILTWLPKQNRCPLCWNKYCGDICLTFEGLKSILRCSYDMKGDQKIWRLFFYLFSVIFFI